jgi:hypothetical protein
MSRISKHEICENCRWFERGGICCRYPPRIKDGRQPAVIEEDWCGEFKPVTHDNLPAAHKAKGGLS